MPTAGWKFRPPTCCLGKLAMSDAPSILLVDSNHRDREYYAQRLHISSPDYNIAEATTGQSGLDICVRQPIDCVVMELDLPDMSGFEFLMKLLSHGRHPEVAVIVLTGLSNPSLLELALKNGAHAAFRKIMTSGDMLEQSILKAIATVARDRKRRNQGMLSLSNFS